MIEFVIAYDERDVELGSYFQKCRDELVSLIAGLPDFPHANNDVPTKLCNRAYLDIALKRLIEAPFVLVAYMHGNPNQLLANGSRFVDANEDNTCFQHSLFYTNSCSTGKLLGPSLIEQHCCAFIGFDSKVDALRGDYEDMSIKCDNYGIYALLTQDINVNDAFEQMKDNYTREICKLRSLGDPLSAGILISVREALVFHGDRTLTKDDLQII